MPEIPFGAYTLVRRLAVGGMAEVFLARKGGAPELMVLKQILPQLAEDPEILALFRDEAAICSRLSHPGIVSITDFGQVEGTYYLAMEYVDGLDLYELYRLARGTLPFDRTDVPTTPSKGVPASYALRVIIDLARTVHYVHQATDLDGRSLEIVHRDISPQNVFLGRTGAVKLGDFGIARARIRAAQTATGVLRGKLAYLAPERFLGLPADRRVDVYSLGVVLFELLAGRRPFEGDDPQFIHQIVNQDPPRLGELLPGVDRELDRLIDRALARAPAARIESAGELAEALEALGLANGPEALGAYVGRLIAQKAALGKGGSGGISALAAVSPPTETLPGRLDEAATPEAIALEGPTTAIPTGAHWKASRPVSDITSADPTVMIGGERTAPIPVGEAGEPAASAPLVDPAVVKRPSVPVAAPVLAPRSALLRALVIGSAILVAILAGRVVVKLGAREPPPAQLAPDEERDPAEDPVPVLEVVEVGTSSAAEDAPGDAVRPGVESRDHAPRRGSASRRPRARPAPAARTSYGELSIDTEPWSLVTIEGKSLGPTPLAHVRLSSGDHQVKLENPEQNLNRAIRISIKADQRTAIRIRLKDGKVLR